MSLVDKEFDTIVLLGCSGSGKSYLAAALRRLPETLFIDELVFPPCVSHILNQNISAEIRNALQAGLVNNMFAYANAGNSRSRLNAFADYLSGRICSSDLLSKLRRRHRVRTFVVESSFFSFSPRFFFDSLPRVKIIHVVRDGRMCAAKLDHDYHALSDDKLTELKSPEAYFGSLDSNFRRYTPSWLPIADAESFHGSSSYLRCVWFWRELVSQLQTFSDSTVPEQKRRFLTVKYEDLDRDPTGTLKDVCRFIARDESKIRQISLPSRQGDHRLHAHLAALNPDDLTLAYQIAERQLDYFGYGSTCFQ